MRVGIYVDAFNVYYGGRALANHQQDPDSWKWFNLAGFAMSQVDAGLWPNASIANLSYCSAPRSQTGDTRGSADQNAYFDALEAQAVSCGYEFQLELGRYVHTKKSGLLLAGTSGNMVRWTQVQAMATRPRWLRLRRQRHVDGVEYALGDFKAFEEKGSDVNVASRLLVDVISREVDAAIVFSNDSDLAYPLAEARKRVPVGLINPTARPTASHLKADRNTGVGGHWWRRMSHSDFAHHQLPNPCGIVAKPKDW